MTIKWNLNLLFFIWGGIEWDEWARKYLRKALLTIFFLLFLFVNVISAILSELFEPIHGVLYM